MRIGVPSEVKVQEHRVGLVPSSVRELVARGHEVVVQAGAAKAIGITDEDYRKAGAQVVDTPAEVFDAADLIVKIKEPQAEEGPLLRSGQTLFTYLHLAPDPDQTRMLEDRGVIAIAYETVTDKHGGLPLLAPMSEVAGRMAVHVAAHYLEMTGGGSGVLMGGVAGVEPAKVVILGGGVVGSNAARMAVGLHADVTIINRTREKLAKLDIEFGGRVKTLFSTVDGIEQCVVAADVVIGAALVAGAATPRLVTRDMVARMRRGSVLVDVAIDQGGCFETSRPTTHDHPIYEVDGVIHYAVTNMPGGVARTSTFAINNATLPFVLALADKGPEQAVRDDVHLRNGLNVYQGKVTCRAVAEALGEEYIPAADLLGC